MSTLPYDRRLETAQREYPVAAKFAAAAGFSLEQVYPIRYLLHSPSGWTLAIHPGSLWRGGAQDAGRPPTIEGLPAEWTLLDVVRQAVKQTARPVGVAR
jgi:hypothetical protein